MKMKEKTIDLMPALAMKKFHKEKPKRLGLWGTLVISNLAWITIVFCLGTFLWTSTQLGANLTSFYLKQQTKWNEQKAIAARELAERNEKITRLVALQTSSPGDVVRLATNISQVLNSTTGTRREFLEEAVPQAIRMQVQYDIPASAILAMAIYESGYGKSSLAKEYHNYFGMKAFNRWKGPRAVSMPTIDSGVKTRADFRAYSSLGDGFEGFSNFLKESKRYRNAFKQTRGVDFVREALRAGYCPDSDYLTNIKVIMARHNLEALEQIIDEGANSPYQLAWNADGSLLLEEESQKDAKEKKSSFLNWIQFN